MTGWYRDGKCRFERMIDYDHDYNYDDHQVELGPGGLLGGKERKGRSTKTVVECKREGLVSLIFFQLFFPNLPASQIRY